MILDEEQEVKINSRRERESRGTINDPIYGGWEDKERLFVIESFTRPPDRKILELTFEEVKHLVRQF